MKISEPKDVEKVKNFVLRCYEEQECYLLPYPGDEVAKGVGFTGRVAGKLNNTMILLYITSCNV